MDGTPLGALPQDILYAEPSRRPLFLGDRLQPRLDEVPLLREGLQRPLQIAGSCDTERTHQPRPEATLRDHGPLPEDARR